MPLQNDAIVSGERILRALNGAVNKMRAMFALQKMKAQEWDELKKLIPPNDFNCVLKLCHQFQGIRGVPEPTRLTEALPRTPSEYVKSNGEYDYEVHRVIKAITRNDEAKAFLLKKYTKECESQFLNNLDEMSEYMKERVSQSPQAEKQHDLQMIQLFNENEAMKNQIAALHVRVDNLEKKQKGVFVDKDAVITSNLSKISLIQKNCEEYIKDRVAQSGMTMLHDWKTSEHTQEELMEEVKQQQNYLENSLKDRLTREKELRVRRYKVESQLVTLLQTYDIDIGDRHNQQVQLEAALEEEKMQLEILQAQYDEQEVEYMHLMNEKEKYERAVWAEKLYQIQCKIAARVIQRAFRRHLERTKSRKRGRRGKGKKK